MVLVTFIIVCLHVLVGVVLAKFAYQHWGFWSIFPAFLLGLLVFYVVYQGGVNLLSRLELRLRKKTKRR